MSYVREEMSPTARRNAALKYLALRSVTGVTLLACALAGGAFGCGSNKDPAKSTSGGSNGAQDGASGAHDGSGGASSSAQQQTGPTTAYDGGFGYTAALDGGPQTKLPPLPPLSNVVAQVGDDSVSITFDPFDGALDYRVYPLPADGDITAMSSGQIVVKNGTYRCAGNRESAPPNVDNTMPTIDSDGIDTQVDQEMVGGYLRTLDNSTIGYVYTQPGPGRVPVYVLGQSDPNADTTCFFARWEQSRSKIYTTSETDRETLLAGRARDDGIQFYVPQTADGTTTQIYFDNQGSGAWESRYYFPDGPEAAVHSSKTPAFLALTSQAPGTLPLKRVFYSNECGWSHDELAVGQDRFNRAYKQGDKLPLWSLLWTGLTGPTTLVVEALDSVCPYQGLPSAQSLPSVANEWLHQPFSTIDDMRAASATTEVFINGQAGPAWKWDNNDGGPALPATQDQLTANTGAGVTLPKPIARSFIQVKPVPHPAMDFLAKFSPGDTPETFTPVTNGPPSQNCAQDWRYQSPTWDVHLVCMDPGPTPGSGLYAFGPVMGELWTTFGDNGADTNGKIRFTAKQAATMSATSFLHVTMEADSYSTARRYPQILISDQTPPVQYNLVNGHTLVIQPRGETSGSGIDWPIDYDLQICNMRTWDVNNQCPQYDLHDLMGDDGGIVNLAPNAELGEHASADHRVLYDVFASTSRVYLFLDGEPYACANLPATGAPPAGPVTVTYGDVLYHSAVDHTYQFHTDHEQIETHRHFDNLGFSSGVNAPTWDESKLPCASPIAL